MWSRHYQEKWENIAESPQVSDWLISNDVIGRLGLWVNNTNKLQMLSSITSTSNAETKKCNKFLNWEASFFRKTAK